MNKIILGLTLIALAACSDSTDQPSSFPEVKVEYQRKVKLSDLIKPDIHYLPLETQGAPLLGEVFKIVPTDTSYYILDAHFLQQIVSFDTAGHYKFTIGKLGKGEGEYSAPKDFLVSTKGLEVFDKNKYAILKYTHEGNFISEERVLFSIHEMERIGENRLIYTPEDAPDSPASDVLYVLSKNYQTVEKSFFPYENVIDDAPFFGYLSKLGDTITYCKPLLGELYTIDSTLSLAPRFTIDFGPHSWPLSREELTKDVDRSEEALRKGGVMSVIHRMNETKDFLVFRTLMLDKDQNMGNVDESEYTWLCIYHKKLNRIIAIKEIVNDMNGGAFGFPIAVKGERFISALSAERMLELGNENNKRSSSYVAMIDSMDVVHNPVLMEYSIDDKIFNKN